ncbi:MAG TPA: hypothetical protein VN259_06985 [Xanthomonadales bacterium]|nr:hypothetical protein [Xanthomonadales bacterium]
MDQALCVLQATSDGDLLAPADLSLLQLVVNRGLDALSAAGVQRWDYMVRSTQEGNYQRPWLHGVENLLRRNDGYVLWRDAIVEHYSYDDRKAERISAQRLGACCRLIEQRGLPVTASALDSVWTELDLGAGLALQRWHVVWATARLDKGAAICCLDGDSKTEVLFSRGINLERQARNFECDSRDLRSMVVVTTEDRQAVLAAITRDGEWEQRARPGLHRADRARLYESMLASAGEAIDASALPNRTQVEARILWPVWPSWSDAGGNEAVKAAEQSPDAPSLQERQRG